MIFFFKAESSSQYALGTAKSNKLNLNGIVLDF